jgi:type 1 glutamine amidotransferase
MHRARATGIVMCVAVLMGACVSLVGAGEPQQGKKIRVVITTGGHPFDRNGFFAMWDSFAGVQWRETSQTKTSDALAPANLDSCDVVVMYDMMGNITGDEEAALQAFLKRRGGLVVLHHTICSRQQSATFERIVGGKFLSKPETRDGKEFPKSVPTAGVKFRVRIADQKHPITEGMTDFDIEDEPYANMIVDPRNQILLTTDEPKSTREIAWARRVGGARVAFIQLGHDNKVYANPSYRKLVERAVEWAAGRISEGKRQE